MFDNMCDALKLSNVQQDVGLGVAASVGVGDSCTSLAHCLHAFRERLSALQ